MLLITGFVFIGIAWLRMGKAINLLPLISSCLEPERGGDVLYRKQDCAVIAQSVR
jgi:hypothetical protein